MAGLDKFLAHLRRSEVGEIVLQSGAVAAAIYQGKMVALARQPLTVQEIIRLIQTTPLIDLLPAQDGSSRPTVTELYGQSYVATLSRKGSRLEVRVARKGQATSQLGHAPAQRDRTRAAIGSVWGREAPATGVRANVGAPPASAESETRISPPPEGLTLCPETAVEQSSSERSFRLPAEDSRLSRAVEPDAAVNTSSPLRSLLQRARAESASDLHLMAGEPARLRTNGKLVQYGGALSDVEIRRMIEPLLNDRSKRQLEELGYTDFASEIQGIGRLRVNVCNQRSGLKGCFRLVMQETPTLDSLGLPQELRQILRHHQGLVVISGPNGAGKTTTLAALVDLFNAERRVHIITVEDPVEIVYPIKQALVTQREVGAHTSSFQSALKGALREDPDVIAIGELRDRETVEKALEASETGHLVFATMSTPSGSSTIDRLIDMFPPDDQAQVRATLAGALKFVVSQRLVPRKAGDGRIAAVELLTGSIALWSLIRDDKLFQLPSLLQRGRAFGMIRIEDSLKELVTRGQISLETATAFADDPRLLADGPRPQSPDPTGAKSTRRALLGKKGR